MKKLVLLFISYIILTSCSIFRHDDSYDKLPLSWKELVVPLETFEQVSRSEITKINGYQLQTELKKHEKAVVQFIVNYCPSNSNLKPLEAYCLKNDYKLFLVMFDFDRVPFIFNQNIESPVFVMDSEYYKSKKQNDYTNAFRDDLANNLPKYAPYYVFYSGVYQPNLGDELKKELTANIN